jgi:peroxiredoxin (alkyl hydroperoxide reductase subunit C)
VAETSANLHQLPPNLPPPVDDGACDHLPGSRVPTVRLASTGGRVVDLAEIAARPAVFFFYPRTGEPGKAAGPDWDAISGSRLRPELRVCDLNGVHEAQVAVFGISTQETGYQGEFVARNLPRAPERSRLLLPARSAPTPSTRWSGRRP